MHANLHINNVRYPQAAKNDLVISWAHRDRLSQTVSLITQTNGNVGPETGVTYTLRIYGESGSLRCTYSGLTGTSQTYTLADDTADPNLGLNYGWILGESGWGTGMDTNLKRLGAVVGLSVIDRDLNTPPAR